jgi:hypothetical protein
MRLATSIAGLALLGAGSFLPAAETRDWSEPVEIRHEEALCVAYRARLSGDYLVVSAAHEPKWHTYAMDNKVRALEKLAGKQSLGIDKPTELTVSNGLELAGPWMQTPPKDLSQPELRLFAWAYEGEAMFVAKVKKTGPGPAKVGIRGQACSESTCKNIDVAISVPMNGSAGKRAEVELKGLLPVRSAAQ